MRKIIICISLILICYSIQVNAQDKKPAAIIQDKAVLGLGAGLDYGGFGANLLFYPHKNFGFFIGGGYALADIGYNFGIKYRFFSDYSKAMPYFLAMYGYNTAIVVSNSSVYDKLFYGPTVGVGVDFRSKPLKQGYWSLGLLVPIRGIEVDDYMNDLKNNHSVVFKNSLLPFGITIGYKIILN